MKLSIEPDKELGTTKVKDAETLGGKGMEPENLQVRA
jgi:hypothetical protein